MREIEILSQAGSFAENKDVARTIRLHEIMPALKKGEEVILDFKGVDATTQSFVHALISQVLREQGTGVLDRLAFKNCNATIQQIVTMVVEYMQEGMDGD